MIDIYDQVAHCGIMFGSNEIFFVFIGELGGYLVFVVDLEFLIIA